MTRLPNVPGPGEQNDPDYLQAEAVGGPIPEGEMPGLDGTPFSHLAFEPEDAADLAEGDAPMVQHRAGMDRRVIFAVCAETGQPEARLDGSSNEVPHEAIIDPAQDNAGAQPDPL